MENGLIGRDEARDVFWSLGLTYGSVLKKKYIGKLLEMLDVSFAEAKKKAKLDPMTGKKDVYWEKTLKTVSKPRPDPFGRKTAVCYIQASGAYFKKRECISFNPSMDDERKHEWIGFCGDASDENADIVTRTFCAWCDCVAADLAKNPGKEYFSASDQSVQAIPGCFEDFAQKKVGRGEIFIENVLGDGIFLAGPLGLKYKSEDEIAMKGDFIEGETDYLGIAKGSDVRINGRYIKGRRGGMLFGKEGKAESAPRIVDGKAMVFVSGVGDYPLNGLSLLRRGRNA
jgi:hypothetical protein